jgi:hypothetical protein
MSGKVSVRGHVLYTLLRLEKQGGWLASWHTLFWTSLEPGAVASIERTAYPRFKAALSAQELQALYAPTEEERELVATHARTDTQQLTLLTLLKCHQSLGYLPAFETIPAFIRQYLCQQFHLPPETASHTAKNLRSRYRYLIRGYLAVTAYANGGDRLVEQRVTQAASTMSDPADLINVAVEHLIQQRFELPAFQTLDRLVSHVRYEVHQTLYTQITAALSEAEKTRLDALISVHAGRSELTRTKDTPRRATLTHLRQWTERLTWLEAILTPQAFLHGITHTKIQQFAAEAAALDLGDIRAVLHGPRRWSLLLCFLHHAQVQTRDQLVEMLLKRMRHTTNAAKKRLKERHEQHRELEEQMLAVFSEVLDHTIDIPEDEEATLDHSVRHLLKTHRGAEALRERYEQVSTYHHDNYRPLMWGFYRPYHAELFRLSHLLTFRSATHQHALLDALAFIQRFQHVRGDYVPAEISLDFASVRWQALVRTQRRLKTVLKRRALEVCVFYYLDSIGFCIFPIPEVPVTQG